MELPIEICLNPTYKKLKEGYRFTEDFKIDVLGIYIPKGYETDGASIPSPFWVIVGTPYNPRVLYPAIVHDWLYACHAYSRRESDLIFYKLLGEAGIANWRREAMYAALRVGGLKAWGFDKKDIDFLSSLEYIKGHKVYGINYATWGGKA